MSNNPFDEIFSELAEIRKALDALKNLPQKTTEIIDRPELLKRLAITEPTAIRYGKKGIIPEIKIGNSIRYNWNEVIKSLEKKSKQ